jgi:L-cystine uptake protein TcyP (sodium:dicarboxylate symporter family)
MIFLIESGLSASIAEWVALPGRLFLTLIQMIVIPLVFASIIKQMVKVFYAHRIHVKKGGIHYVV